MIRRVAVGDHRGRPPHRQDMKRLVSVMALAALVLSGCAATGVEQRQELGPAVRDDTVAVLLSESSVNSTSLDVVVRKLPDGRWVTCVVLGVGESLDGSGIDCDWDNASDQRPGN